MRFAGYAALFGKADAAKDTILQGAFQRTLGERSQPLPLFWQHKPDQRIGWIERAEEDSKGLCVVGQIDNPAGLAGQKLQRREISGLSFGYRARSYHKAGNSRTLAEVDLFEISLVSYPLQHGARIHLLD